LIVRFHEGPLGAVSDIASRESRAASSSEAAPEGSSALIAVADLKFAREPYRDVIAVDLDGRARFRHENGSKGRSTLIIRNATLPEALARTLDVGAFGGDV